MKTLSSWRRMRKAANEGFSKSAVKGFYETQHTEAVILASDLLAHPAQWDRHYRRAPASTTLSVLYDYPTLKSEEDQNVKAINEFAERIFNAASNGSYLVHFFPWLRYVPSRSVPSMHHNHNRLIEIIQISLAKWKRDAEAWYKQDTATFERLFKTVEANIVRLFLRDVR